MPARLKLFLPLILFAVLAAFLLRGLQLDPTELPSALIDQPLPAFSLTALGSGEALTRESVTGQVALFNVWATWCVSCRVEHPYLTDLGAAGVAIYGVNYKDDDAAAITWLEQLGDPYILSIADREGTLGLDLGVYGAPETYLVDAAGVVRYRHVGVVDERVWTTILAPIYRELGGQGGPQ
ncbi:thiol:disulfide interchange protein [Halioglobus japonicus]|uniref:DsbE family thiol:disulfide interchange protein n=1 Tax=Halioglobus japonicus TaxID=930805 RepID=A0AAP8MFI2_9GAMM|nr:MULTISPECIES: DsbE family thiol:disulfide interchange protein [Halioglobus]AQA18815.1 thiol:disulfide interchange protein [Halioglobus japonicus]KZX60271.1 thiol:disulfide interchange protein [Halioglobus sp. HI00S01]PLW86847.1 DsbE family thiol:disulfide interchange protein [Halioglobus japonicus]GHD23745.1 thiol:disulfide interchange protein DsbE [Halioglobus japonicus]